MLALAVLVATAAPIASPVGAPAGAGVAAPAAPPVNLCPRGDAPGGGLAELKHARRLRTVDVTDGHALVTFEDVLENNSDRAATLELGLGAGGVVRAAFIEEPGLAPRAAALDDAERASALFQEYTRALGYGVPPEEAADSAARAAILVAHAQHDDPAVSVVMPCSVRRVVVRVEMLLPSVPMDGAWLFRVPGAPGEGVIDDLVVDSADPVRVLVEGVPLAPGTQQSAPTIGDGDEDGMLTLTVKPLTGARLRARGFALSVSPTAAALADDGAVEPVDVEPGAVEPVAPVVVARAELDLPRPLADAPAGLRLVFVVDASVSMGGGGVAKALQIVNAILDEAPPDARFALVSAGRRPRVLVAAWRARDDRQLPAITVENGSDVLAALAKARAIAADVGDDELARVITLSDMQLRFVDDDARVAHSFTSRASDAPLTHVVVLPDDADIETPLLWARAFRDDDARAAGPESSGGIWVDAGWEDESALFAHLIRPTRVDRPHVTLGGENVLLDPDGTQRTAVISGSPVDDAETGQGADGLPLFLREGSGLRVEVALPPTSTSRDLRVGGLLWATPLNERVRRDQSLLGLVAVNAIGANLDDELVRTIARQTHVVSRVTSLVDVPAFRPATDDLMGLGVSGVGCSCCCGGSRCGLGRSTCGVGGDLREQETLERLLREDARACLVSHAALAIEVGDLEILDVRESEGGACVVERFWQHRLDLIAREPGAFHGHKEIRVRVDVHDG